jgi:hypothetical protein
MEPDMKLDRQVRKGIGDANATLDVVISSLDPDWNMGLGPPDAQWYERNIAMLRRAKYALAMVDQMVASAVKGEPRPWSDFAPMIAEEFGE